ncbi:hypothetical protein G6F46_013994 [Rhizopus delemar]|uniref:Uncharacterized protein n=2 Tax=Rhizopus TaxID=4842 RepID=A0A9P6XXQ8_9FUNG|nr:hypothetical protein G6F54_013628 [Rhizopus delemar]KAG1529240.1 hypothetical protein G6F51_014211 [Rhizopus arrhizus]KAG1488317.1 hypothetical protein G6F53_013603 [Rhizopus delemar]KAG1504604.1 hypothetical protein G6F52_012168 [Rhizopus delemar]KAG1534851.1 hypothetical protein G6F50_015457 [Rhizopus delemar]
MHFLLRYKQSRFEIVWCSTHGQPAVKPEFCNFLQQFCDLLYTQIVHSQLEYGLAISAVSSSNITKLETCQTQCIRRIFGGGSRSSTKVMLHLTNQPTMKERVHRLQAKFLFRSINAPEDTLLSQFLEYLRTSASLSQWYKLSKAPLFCSQK